MKRRLYFLFPDTEHAQRAFEELRSLGIAPAAVHTVARADVDLAGLPVATALQRRDVLAKLETSLWDANLLLFLLAFVAAVAALILGAWTVAVVLVALMAACVSGGAWFAIRLPHFHLDDFRPALQHGEVLLLVDVARERMDEVEALIEKRHPEVVSGGGGWTLTTFGI